MNNIQLLGAKVNNLKNIDLNVPKKKITVFTGVSGSGKSSVVFDIIAEESSRLLNETLPAFVRTFLPKHSRPDVDEINNISPAIVIDQKRIGGNSRSTVGTITDIDPLLRILFSRIGSPHVGHSSAFSFNMTGMCKTCEGIGKNISLNIKKSLDFDKSLNGGAILLPGYKVGGWSVKLYTNTGFFDNDKAIKDYTQQELDKLLYGPEEKFPLAMGLEQEFNAKYMGLVTRFKKSTQTTREKSESSQKKMEAYTEHVMCEDCRGTRYNQDVLNCKINNLSIADMQCTHIDELVMIIQNITDKKTQPVVLNLLERLQDLIDIGLGYLSLNRETTSLSGGESQRIKMVKNLRSGLVDMLYIFDEPSIGLHPRDVGRLNDILIKLKNRGNTVIVVEHDPDVIKIADYIIDMGPGAGSHGGKIVYEGDYENLLASNTLTGQHMQIVTKINQNPKPAKDYYTTSLSSINNLKNISVSIPKGIFTVVTGVSGSGKSSLIHHVFAKEYPQAIIIDQSSVGTTSRSTPATYTGIMDDIRKEFATASGESPSLFSFNSEGACPVCGGAGQIEHNMAFMDTQKITCETCEGKRFNDKALQVVYKGHNIGSVLGMTIKEALEFFSKKEIESKLAGLDAVGLSYLTLGQSLNTLSGGECQRIKLAKELNKKGNIYIMDEPTTGLHFSDIEHIIKIINQLTKKGNTVVTIEHNLDIIRAADYIIDLGPESGQGGGSILYAGTPAGLKECRDSVTGKYI
ncbi:MAG: excinuclease ABC subunit UvrA [Defluviitaleaceae bacterium]|nr:excinuclease ABC subunit UvrA [Defluviitaleaceae bacterium]